VLVDNCVIRNYTPSALCYPPRWGKNPGLSTIIHLAVWIPFSVVGDRDVDVLAPGEVDDACISAGIASVPLDDAAVAVVLDVPPCARELKVLVPSLGVCSKVSFAAAVGGGEDKRLSREDTVEDAVATGDDRFEKLDERVLDSVVAVDKEELRGGAVETVEWHFHCIDQVAAVT